VAWNVLTLTPEVSEYPRFKLGNVQIEQLARLPRILRRASPQVSTRKTSRWVHKPMKADSSNFKRSHVQDKKKISMLFTRIQIMHVSKASRTATALSAVGFQVSGPVWTQQAAGWGSPPFLLERFHFCCGWPAFPRCLVT